MRKNEFKVKIKFIRLCVKIKNLISADKGEGSTKGATEGREREDELKHRG